MKISPKQYAISLYEATHGAPEVEVGKNIENFVKILRGDNDFKKIDKIIEAYEVYEREQRGAVQVELTTAKKMEEQLRAKVVSYLKTNVFPEVKEVEVSEKVDESLVGGIVIKSGDKVMDGSLSRRLRVLKKALVG